MKRRHFYLAAAVFLGVVAGSYTGWLVYQQSIGGTGKIFASADEDPGSTLRQKTDTAKAPVTVSGKVVNAKNKPQSGIIKIAGQEITVTGGQFEASIIPGVYKVTFTVDDVSAEMSPPLVQIINSGQYDFVIED